MLDNMTDNIYKLLDVDSESLRELSAEQKKMLKGRFTNNLLTVNVYYGTQDGNDALIFENPQVFKNWQYYAGLEYCKGDCLSCFQHYSGDYVAVMSGHDRIDNIVDALRSMEENDE